MLLLFIFVLLKVSQCISSRPYVSFTPSKPYFLTNVWSIYLSPNTLNPQANYTINPTQPDILAVTTSILKYSPMQTNRTCVTCPESEINFANPSMNISMNLYYNCDGASILTFMAIFLLSSTEKFMILQNLPSVKFQNLSVGNGTRSEIFLHAFPSTPVDIAHQIVLLPFIRCFMHTRNFTRVLSLEVNAQLVNESAYIVNYTTKGNCLVAFAGVNLIVLDVSLSSMCRDTVWQVGSVVAAGTQPPFSTGLTSLNNSYGITGISGYELATDTETIDVQSPSYPLVFNSIPTYVSYRMLQVQSVTCFPILIAYRFFVLELKGCYDWCPEGYVASSTFCYLCHADCLTCSGPLRENCTSCATPKQLTAHRCICPSPQGNSYSGECIDCDHRCSGCYGTAGYCLGCAGIRVRQWNGSCSCPIGYTEVNASKCVACHQLFQGCSTCTSDVCLDCYQENNFQMQNNSCECLANFAISYFTNRCQPCSLLIPGCLQCSNLSYCLECNANFTLLKGYCRCQLVNQYAQLGIDFVAVCASCPSQCGECLAGASCISCIASYQLSSNGSCQPICGDGIVLENECQDNNTNNGDGCSSNCTVEQDYVCRVGSAGLSVCLYTQAIEYSLILQFKEPLSNQMRIVLHPIQQLPLDTRFNVTAENCSVQVQSYDGRFLTLLLNYQQTLQFETIDIQLTPKNGLLGMTLTTSRVLTFICPDNLPAYWYEALLYLQAKIAGTGGLVLSAAAASLFLINLLGDRGTAYDSIWPAQTVYLGQTSGTAFTQPVWNAFSSNLLPAVGYNKLFINFASLYPQLSKFDNQLKSLELVPLFIHNFNYMLALQLTAVLITVTLYACIRRASNKIRTALATCYGICRRLSLALAFFNIPQVFFSAGLNIAYLPSYGVVDNSANLAAAVFTIVLLLSTFRLPIMDTSDASADQSTLSQDTRASYLMVLTTLRAALSLAAGLLHYTGYSAVTTLFFQLWLLVYYSISNNFADRLSKGRSITIQCLAMLVSACSMAVSDIFINQLQGSSIAAIACWIAIGSVACCSCLDFVFTIRLLTRKNPSQ